MYSSTCTACLYPSYKDPAAAPLEADRTWTLGRLESCALHCRFHHLPLRLEHPLRCCQYALAAVVVDPDLVTWVERGCYVLSWGPPPRADFDVTDGCRECGCGQWSLGVALPARVVGLTKHSCHTHSWRRQREQRQPHMHTNDQAHKLEPGGRRNDNACSANKTSNVRRKSQPFEKVV